MEEGKKEAGHLVGELLVELPWVLPREKPDVVLTALQEAHHLLRHASSSRLCVLLTGGRVGGEGEVVVQVKELEEALVATYVASMKVTSGRDEDTIPQVVVLPPFTASGYDPRVDLPHVEAVYSLGPVVAHHEQERINAARSSKGLPHVRFGQFQSLAGVFTTSPTSQTLTRGFPAYSTSVLGGTFDRLHAGHKLMLTVAVLLTTKKIVIGITGEEMLKNKKHGEVMQSFPEREANVLKFLNGLNPLLTYEAVEINDPYGPTLTEPTFDAIVVSEETQKGAVEMNEKRKAAGLSPLEVIVVQLVSAPPDLGDGKLSSTLLRESYKKHHH